MTIEDEEVLAEEVEDVRCRWCGTADAVAVVSADPEAVEEAS